MALSTQIFSGIRHFSLVIRATVCYRNLTVIYRSFSFAFAPSFICPFFGEFLEEIRPSRSQAHSFFMPTMGNAEAAFRKSLSMVVSAILKTHGFDSTEKLALETLLEVSQSFISEAGKSAKILCEAAGRTEVIPKDINLALSEMGFNLSSVIPEAHKQLHQGRIYVPPPKSSSQPSTSKPLKVGKVKPHPGHVPEFLPPFPDPHTYLSSDVTEDPELSYRQIRESQAQQKREIECALISFMLKIKPSHLIFPRDKRLTLIGAESEAEPYLSALLPEDTPESAGAETAHLLVDNPYLRQPKLPLRRTQIDDLLD